MKSTGGWGLGKGAVVAPLPRIGIFLLLFRSVAVAAGGPGTSVAPLLKLGPGARPAAMADAFVGVAEEADAGAWNPAGLAMLPRPTATLMYLRLHEQIHYNYLAYGMPWRERFGLGAHLVYAKTDGITRTFEDAGGNFDPRRGGDSFSNSDLKLAFSGAYKALDWLSVGGNLGFFRDAVDDDSATGALFDLSAFAKPTGPASWEDRLAYGLSLQNLGSARGGSSPMVLRLGSSARFSRGLVSAELDRGFDTGQASFGLGGEWLAVPLLALRLGYRFGPAADAGGRRVSFGIGFRFQRAGFDYAVVPFGSLGVSQRVSLTYAFGGQASPRRSEESGRREPERERASPRNDPDELITQAERLLGRRRYAEARGAFERAAALLDEGDERQVRVLERIGQSNFQLGRSAQAKDAYMRALKKAKELGVQPPAVGDAYAGLAACLIKEGNVKYARRLLERALETSLSPGTRRYVELELKKLEQDER